MSIKRASAVWEESAMTKSGLMVLLSIADRADNDGFAWPGLADIADRARIESETAMRVIRAAESIGELYINARQGRGHQYIVCTGQTGDELIEAFDKRFSLTILEAKLWMLFRQITPDKISELTPDKLSGVENLPLTISWGRTGLSVGTPDNLLSTPLTSHSVEPLLNHQLNNHQETREDGPLRENPERCWQETSEQLRREMPMATFDIWVAPVEYHSFANGTLQLAVPNANAKEWLESRLTSTITRLLTGFLGGSVKLQFVISDSP